MLIIPVELVADRVHSGVMSEEITQDMSNRGSFEARVFVRFDSMDARFDSLDLRVGALESHSERRALETKPIWERALAEIGEVKSELGEVKSELGGVKGELGAVKGELGAVKSGLTEVKDRVGALEGATRLMARKLDILNRDLTTLRAEQLGLEDRVERLEPRTLP